MQWRRFAHRQSPSCPSPRSGAALWGYQCACGASAAVCLLARLDVCFYCRGNGGASNKNASCNAITIHSRTDWVQILTSSAFRPNFLRLQAEEKTRVYVALKKERLERVADRELTSKSLQPLLPPSPPQHQQPNEDHNDAHQHAGDGDHHLHAFATTRVVLAHSGSLHQWRNSAWTQASHVSVAPAKYDTICRKRAVVSIREKNVWFQMSSSIKFTAMSPFTPAASLEAHFLIYCTDAAP